MMVSRASPWRSVVVVTALFGLALAPGLGLAQQDQGSGDQSGSQTQKQKRVTKGQTARDKNAQGQNSQGKIAQGARNAPPPKASGRQPAPPPSAKTQMVPRSQQRGQRIAPSVAPRKPQAAGASRSPYSLYQPTTKPALRKAGPVVGNAPRGRTPRAPNQVPDATAPVSAAPRRVVQGTVPSSPTVATPRAGRAPAVQGGGTLTVVRPKRPSRAVAGLPPAVKTPPPLPISRQALTRTVPAPAFRGPQTERKLVAITPQVHQRGVQQLTGWVKQQNSGPAPGGGRPSHDWIGNPVPTDARVFGASSFRRSNSHYGRIENVFGEPRHEYVVLPRTSFYVGFFGQDDGFLGYQRYGHRSFVAISLFYPYYFSQPSWYAFNYPGFYPSVYSMYGWSPGWVYPDRVYYQPEEYVYAPVSYRRGLRLDVAGQEHAISDLRQAWMDDDPTLFSAHLTDQVDVRVYFSGQYSYTSSTSDYLAMTADAMSTTQTAAIDFGDPVWISSSEVFYAGQQTFTDPDGTSRDLYLSYRLRRLGSDWYVVAFGSSPDPIESQYVDFRYR